MNGGRSSVVSGADDETIAQPGQGRDHRGRRRRLFGRLSSGEFGWSDVVLLERKQLTSGTTSHAAGLIGRLRATSNMTKLAKYSAELYTGLKAETGLATGYRRTGSAALALLSL